MSEPLVCGDKSNEDMSGPRQDWERRCYQLADEIEPDINSGGYVSLSADERKLIVEALRKTRSSTASKDKRELYISDLETTVRHCADLLRAVHYNVVADYGTSGDGIIAAEKTLRDVKYFVEHGMSSTPSAIERASLPKGWSVWRTKHIIETYGVKAPEGHVAFVSAADTNPALVLFMLVKEMGGVAHDDIGESRG